MEDFLDQLEIAIEVLVLRQFDLIPFNCEGCETEHQKEGKCVIYGYNQYDDNDDEPVWYSPTTNTEFYSCPISMVPKLIYDLWDMYSFDTEFNVIRDEDTTPALYWWFVKTYKRTKNNIEQKQFEMKNKKRS